MRNLIVLISLLLPTQALAIVNAEDLNPASNQEGFNGKIGLQVSGNSGNSRKFSGEGNGRLQWRHGPHTSIAATSYSYGKSRGVRDTNKSFVHLRHRYAFMPGWEIEGFAQAQQNEFSLLKLRTLFGGGLRWSVTAEQWASAIGLGSFYERETLKPAANEPTTRLWRGNAYLSLSWGLNERVRLQNTLYYQPAWKRSADFRLLDDAGLNVALTDQLDLKLVMEMTHDSRPPATVVSTDISYKTGLEMRF